MERAALKGYATATDLADYLVKKGLPFRDAHETVAHAVKAALAQGVDLARAAAGHAARLPRRDRRRRVRGADAARLADGAPGGSAARRRCRCAPRSSATARGSPPRRRRPSPPRSPLRRPRPRRVRRHAAHRATPPLDRPPRHGRLLRVGGAAALPGAGRARPVVIGGGRRHQPVLQPDGTRRFATLRRLRRPRRRHHRHLCGARSRRALGHGPDEGRAARARRRAAAGGLRAVPPLFAPLQGRGGRGGAADRGPRHRRDLHRPERRARRAGQRRPRPARRRARGGAGDPQQRAPQPPA